MASGATLVDTNVLLDVLTEDPTWLDWSTTALTAAAEAGPLWINPIVYAEVSVRFSRIEDLEDALPPEDYRRAQLPWEAAFLAGKAFLAYRREGGTKTSTLPDFSIGAHAAIAGVSLLTRDDRRYRTYFPTAPSSRPEPAQQAEMLHRSVHQRRKPLLLHQFGGRLYGPRSGPCQGSRRAASTSASPPPASRSVITTGRTRPLSGACYIGPSRSPETGERRREVPQPAATHQHGLFSINTQRSCRRLNSNSARASPGIIGSC